MEQIERYSALSMLLTAQLKPGVYTNHFLSPAQCEAEIEQGMWFEPFDGGICLFRRREDHDLMTFYLQRDGELPRLNFPRPRLQRLCGGMARREAPCVPSRNWSKPAGQCSFTEIGVSAPRRRRMRKSSLR